MAKTAEQFLELLCADATDPRAMPATVIVAAHPDDEVVGAGARLPRLRGAVFVHVTNGSPENMSDAVTHGFASREEYSRARRQELESALALAGIDPGQTRELGCVDQRASFALVGLSRRAAEVMREIRPETVLTHPYEGGHPDHDATAFIVHAACRLMEQQGERAPAVLEMTSYHLGPNGIEPFTFLPAPGHEAKTLVLSPEERQLKRRMLECFRSQQETLQYFPVELERYRIAPRYDFTVAPHQGKLFYELYLWGMEGERFRSLARDALQELGMQGEI